MLLLLVELDLIKDLLENTANSKSVCSKSNKRGLKYKSRLDDYKSANMLRTT